MTAKPESYRNNMILEPYPFLLERIRLLRFVYNKAAKCMENTGGTAHTAAGRLAGTAPVPAGTAAYPRSGRASHRLQTVRALTGIPRLSAVNWFSSVHFPTPSLS